VSPLSTLAQWIGEAQAEGVREPDAMALATVGPGGAPSVRFVLCRGVDEAGLRFFTNYESRKGLELEANVQAAAVFHWAASARQVRVEGRVEKLSAEESDAYFRTRPRGSRIASAVSPQSRPIAISRRVSRGPKCRVRRTGAGTFCAPRRWSSGAVGRIGCTIGSATCVVATAGS
jgi:pyridoxamine 5'-phosphate oxidase